MDLEKMRDVHWEQKEINSLLESVDRIGEAGTFKSHGAAWRTVEKLGTHNKHLSVLDFEKQEIQKEVAELEQTISGNKEGLSSIPHQQMAAEQETEQIRKEGETIRQELSELSVTNHLLKEQMETLTADKEKLLSENEKLGKQQKSYSRNLIKWCSLRKSWSAVYTPMMKMLAVGRTGGIDGRKGIQR